MVMSDLSVEAKLSGSGLLYMLTPTIETVIPPVSLETALGASATTYFFVGSFPLAVVLQNIRIRTKALSVAGSTLTFGYAVNGVACSAGTAISEAVNMAGITAMQDYNVVLAGPPQIPAGAVIYGKIVTGAAETLTPVTTTLTFGA